MWIDTRLDEKLKKYLTRCEVNNLETVKAVYAFGLLYDEDGYLIQVGSPIVHHRIFSFEDLKPTQQVEYYRIMVVFKNGGTTAWDFIPSEWGKIDKILELELSSAE